MSIILEITESDEQMIYGIPYYITVSTNVPSNVFYTLDGSDPDVESLLVVDEVYLPSNSTSITFKAKAISSDDESEIFSETYVTKYGSVSNTRKGNEAGVVVMTADSTVVDSLGYDSEGNSARETSIEFVDLDMRASKEIIGEPIKLNPQETSLDFVNFSLPSFTVDRLFRADTVNDNINFDPKAKVISIDGSSAEKMSDQSVTLINRSHETFEPASKFYKENEHTYRSIISGNLVRHVYNNKTGEIIFYYYESKESRWIISKQKTEKKTLNLSFANKNPFVYKWIKDPVMSKIF